MIMLGSAGRVSLLIAGFGLPNSLFGALNLRYEKILRFQPD